MSFPRHLTPKKGIPVISPVATSEAFKRIDDSIARVSEFNQRTSERTRTVLRMADEIARRAGRKAPTDASSSRYYVELEGCEHENDCKCARMFVERFGRVVSYGIRPSNDSMWFEVELSGKTLENILTEAERSDSIRVARAFPIYPNSGQTVAGRAASTNG